MNKPMYLVLSTQTGTSSAWAGAPNGGETGQMQVDYLRAYSSKPSGAADTPANPQLSDPQPATNAWVVGMEATRASAVSLDRLLMAATRSEQDLRHPGKSCDSREIRAFRAR